MWFVLKLKVTQKGRQVVHSKAFLGILSLAIGIGWTFTIMFSHYEGANIMRFVRETVAEAIHPSPLVFVNPAYAAGLPKVEIPKEKVIEKKVVVEDTKTTLKRIAEEQGIDWKILMGICMEESRGCTKGEIGDSGASIGWFQINKPEERGITSEQAHDLEFSARWTAERLKRYATIGGWDYAIRKHNGNADYNFGPWKESFSMTERYLARVKNNIKSL